MRNTALILFIILLLAGASFAVEPSILNDSDSPVVCAINASESCNLGVNESSNLSEPGAPENITKITDSENTAASGECKKYNVGKCNGTIRALYFYKPNCPHCEKVKPLINDLELRYNLNITRINAGADPTLCLQCATCHNVTASVPMVVLSSYALVGDVEIENKFEGIIKTCLTEGCACIEVPNIDVKPPEQPSLSTLLIAMIIGAAIADALNVCALGILIFLIASVLSKTKRDNKEALKVGLSFIAGIYLMYFVAGIGMFHILKEFVAVIGALILFKKLVGVFALIIGILNLKDYFSYGSLGFAMEVPKSWRAAVAKIVKGVTSVSGAFVAGIVISLFLAPCAVTIYASVVGMMSTMDIPFGLAVLILALYNFAFVLPMIIVVLMVYFGFKRTEGMEMWRQKNKRRMHLLTGILMTVLGIVLIVGLL